MLSAPLDLDREFIDNRRWPEYMRAGRRHALRALHRLNVAATKDHRSADTHVA